MSKRSFAILKHGGEGCSLRISSRRCLELCHLLKKVDENLPLLLPLVKLKIFERSEKVFAFGKFRLCLGG